MVLQEPWNWTSSFFPGYRCLAENGEFLILRGVPLCGSQKAFENHIWPSVRKRWSNGLFCPNVYESFHSFPGHSVCLLMILLQQQWAGAAVPLRSIVPIRLQPILLFCPRCWFPLGWTMSWLPPAETPWRSATGAAANHLREMTSDLCQIHFYLKVAGHFLSWTPLFHMLTFFFSCSGLVSPMLVTDVGIIFMETLNKIPSSSFKLWRW